MSGSALWGDLSDEEKDRFLNSPTYKGTPAIESSADADRRRLDWLEITPMRLLDVRGCWENETSTLREAIDLMMKRQAKS